MRTAGLASTALTRRNDVFKTSDIACLGRLASPGCAGTYYGWERKFEKQNRNLPCPSIDGPYFHGHSIRTYFSFIPITRPIFSTTRTNMAKSKKARKKQSRAGKKKSSQHAIATPSTTHSKPLLLLLAIGGLPNGYGGFLFNSVLKSRDKTRWRQRQRLGDHPGWRHRDEQDRDQQAWDS